MHLIVYENQQTLSDLSTRATMLASMTFRALITITVKFDLKTVQMNIINMFVNSKLNEMIYMRQLSEFEKNNSNTILYLRKTLYELKRSSSLFYLIHSQTKSQSFI